MAADSLVGTWKLVSWQIIVDGRAQDLFGSRPRGFLILTPGGRLMVITTAENRSGGDTDRARIALHRSMLASTGTYRVEGDEFITSVDVSWNESSAVELAGGVSIQELAARWVSGQAGQVPGLGSSILDAPPGGTPGNVT